MPTPANPGTKPVTKPEVWLLGPLPGIPAPLQPVAHTLLQAREELHSLMTGFPETLLWERPAGVASVGFHLQHLTGVLDRLFTYARGSALNQTQLKALSAEGTAPETHDGVTVTCVTNLLEAFDKQVDLALEQLAGVSGTAILETRLVGRAAIPSTQLGLLVHAAEHTMRHLGQLLVTAKVLMNGVK